VVRIAVDAMAADHAPSAIVDGAVAAARHLDVQVTLVEDEAVLRGALASHPDWRRLWIDLVDALLGDELQGTFSSQMGYLLSRRAFRRFRRRIDSSEYGRALLLGVAGLAIVGHGRSSAKAIRNATAMAYRCANRQLVPGLEHEMALVSVPGR
jgi:fatty acid/phospholipid biosynthesis enzyme